jgi:two-component system OmpR family response regulator
MTVSAVGFVHPSTRPLRVLLADDNRDAADSLEELLRLVGCEVRTCYDGGEVLPLAEEFRPDVCVLDLWMPQVDGWEVARRLREWAGGRLLLLVALTGVGGRRAEENSRDAGFDYHILKPADPNDILRDFAAFIKTMELAVLELD